MCQLSRTRQFLRSTVLPCFLAAASAKPHCVGRLFRPFIRHRADRDHADPVLAGQGHARGADLRGDGEGHLLLQRQQLQRRIPHREPVALGGHPLALEQPPDDADRLVLAVALGHRVDPERVRVRRERPRARAEDRSPAGHPVELDHALGDIERVVVGQRDDAGGELDALRALARRGQEHFRRADHLPAARMVLAAPELVVAEPVELFHEVEIAAELQHRVLADRMVRSKEGTEIQTRHDGSPNGAMMLGQTHPLDARQSQPTLPGLKSNDKSQPDPPQPSSSPFSLICGGRVACIGLFAKA